MKTMMLASSSERHSRNVWLKVPLYSLVPQHNFADRPSAEPSLIVLDENRAETSPQKTRQRVWKAYKEQGYGN